MSWTNSDGLTVLMHEEQGEVETTGKSAVGVRKALIVELEDATTLGTSYSTAAGPTEAFVPANALVVSAHFITTTGFTSAGSGTLSIGFYESDGSVIDADGVDAAVAKTAIDTIGESVVCDGALVDGTHTISTTLDAYVGFIYATAAFTAGAGKLVIEYIEV